MPTARQRRPRPPGFLTSEAPSMAGHDDSTAGRVARVEAEISKHRSLYLRAVWAGHDGEAEHHEREVDRLLGVHQRVRTGAPFTVEETAAT